MNKNEKKEKSIENEVVESEVVKNEDVEQEICGKKFEDLTQEEMEQIQGSGDMGVENITTIWDVVLSKKGYKC